MPFEQELTEKTENSISINSVPSVASCSKAFFASSLLPLSLLTPRKRNNGNDHAKQHADNNQFDDPNPKHNLPPFQRGHGQRPTHSILARPERNSQLLAAVISFFIHVHQHY